MNKVILIGRTTADIELKMLSNQNVVTNFCLAVDREVSKDGEKETDFIDVTAWNKTAEFVTKNFVKGKMIIVIGRITTRSWETQDGNRAYATEVIANEVNFGESKSSQQTAAQPPMQDDDDDFTPLDEEDDDLPF